MGREDLAEVLRDFCRGKTRDAPTWPVICFFAKGQGTRTGVSRSRTCTTMVFIVFNLGILGDEKTHKYPRNIGRFYRDFPWRGALIVGVHPYLSPEKAQHVDEFHLSCTNLSFMWFFCQEDMYNLVLDYHIVHNFWCRIQFGVKDPVLPNHQQLNFYTSRSINTWVLHAHGMSETFAAVKLEVKV